MSDMCHTCGSSVDIPLDRALQFRFDSLIGWAKAVRAVHEAILVHEDNRSAGADRETETAPGDAKTEWAVRYRDRHTGYTLKVKKWDDEDDARRFYVEATEAGDRYQAVRLMRRVVSEWEGIS